MQRAPYRADHKITETYNDGVVSVYTVTDVATPGYQPVKHRTLLVSLPYEERRVGLERYYSARQNQIKVKRVLRVPHSGKPITSQCLAETEDGATYRVDLVQTVPDSYPPSDDLTLVDYEQGVGP